jgi:hypothetical protein
MKLILVAVPDLDNVRLCMFDLLLSQQLSMMKFSWAISWVKWLSGKKTNISKTISVH